jgi:hypothetical protein
MNRGLKRIEDGGRWLLAATDSTTADSITGHGGSVAGRGSGQNGGPGGRRPRGGAHARNTEPTCKVQSHVVLGANHQIVPQIPSSQISDIRAGGRRVPQSAEPQSPVQRGQAAHRSDRRPSGPRAAGGARRACFMFPVSTGNRAAPSGWQLAVGAPRRPEARQLKPVSYKNLRFLLV